MEATIVIAVVTGIVTLIGGFITYAQHKYEKIADMNAKDFLELISTLRGELKDSRAARNVAQGREEEALRDAREARAERDQALAKSYDQRELIEDYRTYHLEQNTWESSGSPPPAPDKSWRLKQDIASFLKSSRNRE